MPTYSLNHVHHESTDVHAAADWYVRLFDAAADEPFERGGPPGCAFTSARSR